RPKARARTKNQKTIDMIKPKHTLLVLIAVLILLGIISLIIPPGGWKINENITINFPTFKRLINPEEPDYKDISQIIDPHWDTTDLNTIDTISAKPDTTRANADSLEKVTHKLLMTAEGRSKLHHFFEELQQASDSQKPVRVWHYGDSQIESDRITSFLRERFQSTFGGQGPGLLSLNPVTQKKSWRVHPVGNWERHTLFGKIDTTLPHQRFGPSLSISRFAPFYNDSVSSDSMIYKGSVNINNSFQGYQHTHQFKKAVLHYGNNYKPVQIKVKDKEDKIIHTDSLPPNKNQYNTWPIPVDPGTKEFSLHFAGYDSPDFYGISLESSNGVIVDNIPLRGSSGLIFTQVNYKYYLQQINRFDVDLIILQFGVNVVSEEREDFSYYERWIYNQLNTIKKMQPDLPVIVIGLSDMAKKKGTNYKSYESVSKIRDALQNATQRAGYCFWDLYEAMGGENSMPSWVFAQPPLANKDFTHFNYRGARIISNMFYNALMFEYREYAKKEPANDEE
ncbi:MAG: GDSL-type esterase/lipase family protein, partial [Bacteroidales bacterium]